MNKCFSILLITIFFSNGIFSQTQKNIGLETGFYYPKFSRNTTKKENTTTKYFINYEANINLKIIDTSKKILNTFLLGISTYNYHFKEYSNNAPSLTYYSYNDDSVLVPTTIIYSNIQKDKDGYITQRGEEKINYVNINFLIGKTFSVLNKLEINILTGGMIGYRYYARYRRTEMGNSVQEFYVNENYPTDKANIILTLPLYSSISFKASKMNVGIYAKTMFPLINESKLNYIDLSRYSTNLKPWPKKPAHNLHNFYAWGIGICFSYSIS